MASIGRSAPCAGRAQDLAAAGHGGEHYDLPGTHDGVEAVPGEQAGLDVALERRIEDVEGVARGCRAPPVADAVAVVREGFELLRLEELEANVVGEPPCELRLGPADSSASVRPRAIVISTVAEASV